MTAHSTNNSPADISIQINTLINSCETTQNNTNINIKQTKQGISVYH